MQVLLPIHLRPLLASKEQYARIHFIHIYSLSPSPIHVSKHRSRPFLTSHKLPFQEPALLCEPAKSLREAGKSLGTGFTVSLGRVTGPSWYLKVRWRPFPSLPTF
jgi:hypothetical protein